MKPKKEAIKDILQKSTKSILIQYILNRWAYDERTERDLAWLQYEEMTNEAKTKMDDAIKKSKSFFECGDHTEWLKQQKLFDDAQSIYDKADKLFKEKISYEAQ